ncbi:Gfo/Idh/MocA family oxidoreductase [Candidatus Peregrinibacteria bacterium]|nr:Gfo/Idh/MocA family oxidoreductase [Candidatus Peregrinibacteria bacterium]
MTGKISFALIGAGGMGARWVRAMKQTHGINVRAVVDVDSKKAKRLASNFRQCESLADWQDLLLRSDIDAVVVVTPHRFLAPISHAFLRKGVHVLSEKPGGVRSTEITQGVALAKKHGVRYMVGFNHRFHPSFLLARTFIEQGKIGELMFIRARYGFGGRVGYQKEWRMHRKFSGGGELIDQGVHMIDMVRSFLGDITSVAGFAEDVYWHAGVDDNAMLVMRSKKKQLASIHVSWSNWRPIHNFEIFGTKGYVSIEGLGKKYGGTEKVILGKRNPKYIDHPIERECICNPDADASLIKELQEFIAAIKEKRNPVPNAADAYEVLKIVEKIYGRK